MSLRSLAGRIKRKILRVLRRTATTAGEFPQRVTGEMKYWRSLQSEVLAQREEIRALHERVDALSARTTTLQREIASLHATSEEPRFPGG